MTILFLRLIVKGIQLKSGAPLLDSIIKSVISLVIIFALTDQVYGDDKFSDHLGATVGGSYSLGKMKNDDMGLGSRTMSALSVEALGGYRFGNLLLGLDLDFRLVDQWTKLSDAGNTNLKGSSWLTGIGAKYTFSSKWSLQGSFGFFGKYDFSNETASAKESSLDRPLAFRLKPQYFPVENLPLSVDLDLRYISWRNFDVAGTNSSAKTSDLSVGVGVTYHFGNSTAAEPAPEPVVTAVAAPVSEPATGDQEKINQLKVDHFAVDSYELTSQAKSNVVEISKIVGKTANRKVKLVGYTDSTGTEQFNLNLSKQRAEKVKSVLVDNGIKSENISTEGNGPANPVTQSKNTAGSQLNRRVEIFIEEGAK